MTAYIGRNGRESAFGLFASRSGTRTFISDQKRNQTSPVDVQTTPTYYVHAADSVTHASSAWE